MTAARRPLKMSDPHDRALLSKLGGLAAQQLLTPEERTERARQRGESTYAKHGREHMVRMALIKAGRLPKTAK